MNIGIIGCGNISPIYIANLKAFGETLVLGLADLEIERAQGRAKEFGILHAMSVEGMLASSEFEIILNLTVPKAHAGVAAQVLRSGMHVYNEKPLGLSRTQGAEILKLAAEQDLRVGCAPDTFLGGGIQTCRALIDQGAIGEPVGAQAFMMCRGHESWHPAPEFYYEVGGGPLFDMGPYYLTALINLLGPIRRVTGSGRTSFSTRTITSEPMKGKTIVVETPTHITGVLEFAQGAIGQITMSFDVSAHTMPHIEIYGSEGSLSVPDPNGFGGPVKIKRGGGDWEEIPVDRPYSENSRGLGVLDMTYGIKNNRPHRASGALAYHVLDAMQAILEASESGRHIELSSGISKPEPMPLQELQA